MNSQPQAEHKASRQLTVAVSFKLKELFKQSVGSWATWDRSNRVWRVPDTPEVRINLSHFTGVLSGVSRDPVDVTKAMSEATTLRVSTTLVTASRTSQVKSMAAQPVVSLHDFQEALEEETIAPLWAHGDPAVIKAVQLDTGYGVLSALGPQDDQLYGNNAHYVIIYESHGAPAALQRQFIVLNGSIEWQALLSTARYGETNIIKRVKGASRTCCWRVVSEELDVDLTELYLLHGAARAKSESVFGIHMPQQPAIAHSAGYDALSILYCPKGRDELCALLKGLAQLDLEAEDSVLFDREEPHRWLVSQRALREALDSSPGIMLEDDFRFIQRACYATASSWIDEAMERARQAPPSSDI